MIPPTAPLPMTSRLWMLGIVRSFRDLAANMADASSAVMAGIAESLIATAVGLLVAASMLIDANIGLVLHLTAPIVSVMVFGLAALVFSLLVCLWTLRMLRSAMPA